MKLYFFRHAEAEVQSPELDDHDRKLTPKGIARAKIAGQVLSALGVKPSHIYASPRVRAHHTAEIIARTLNLNAEIREEVNFSFDITVVETLIAGLSNEHEVMFIGHEPGISQIVGQLTGGNVVMKKGGVARIDVVTVMSPLRGQLTWLIAPKLFDLFANK